MRDAAVGVRARWSRSLAVALLATALGALAGAAVGQWSAWQTAGPLPGDMEAAAVARLALGGPAPTPQRRDHLFGYADGRYGPGHMRYTVPADPRAAAFQRQVKDVRVRLRTAGWRVEEAGGPIAGSPRLLFVADKGERRLRYLAAGDRVILEIVRGQPLLVAPLGALGALLGAALGWFGARWTQRRAAGRTPAARRTVRLLAGLGGVLVVPPVLVTAVMQAVAYAQVSGPQTPLWTAALQPGLRWFTVTGALALAAALVAAAVARPDAGIRTG
jgi:hypothetical protein